MAHEEPVYPLDGLRVLDLATYVAAPFCGTLLAEFGAEVIKVEMPGSGDPSRLLGDQHKGVGLIWAQENRNKKGVTCDLRLPEGRQIIKDLVKKSDVLLENFRPGTLESWGLGYDVLEQVNPGLVMARISGYGQTGPYSAKAGFGRVALAFGGLTYLAGYPDRPPVIPGSPTIADYLAGLFAAYSVMVALEARRKTGRGQSIDISLYESVLRVLDSVALSYDQLGKVRERTGTATPFTVPHNHYPTSDGKWVAVACNNDKIFRRLVHAMKQEALADDPRFSTAAARVDHRLEIDDIISTWSAGLTMDDVVAVLDAEEVPVSPINSIADIFANSHIRERGSIVEVADALLGTARMPGIVPKLSRTPGNVERLGPSLGQHNDEVYKARLGYSAKRLAALRQKRVI